MALTLEKITNPNSTNPLQTRYLVAVNPALIDLSLFLKNRSRKWSPEGFLHGPGCEPDITITPPLLSLNKFRTPSFRRILRFSTSPKSQPPFHGDCNSNNELNHESDSPDSSLVPIFSKDAAMGLVLSAANVRGCNTNSNTTYGEERPRERAWSWEFCLLSSNTMRKGPWSLFTPDHGPSSPRKSHDQFLTLHQIP